MDAFERIRNNPYMGICFALAIEDQEEKILIGSVIQIEKALIGRGEVYYEMTRPIGRLLADYEEKDVAAWTEAIMLLQDAITMISKKKPRYFSPEMKRSECELVALEILRRKAAEENPIKKYIAFKIWEEYLLQCEKRKGLRDGDWYFRICTDLLYPIIRTTDNELRINEYLEKESEWFGGTLHHPIGQMAVTVVYPSDKIKREFAYTASSLLGVKNYYAEKALIKKQYIGECTICGRMFLTKNRMRLVCSSECGKENAKKNREIRHSNKEYGELIRLNNAENRYWDTRVQKIEEKFCDGDDRVIRVLKLREDFRAEQKGKKEQLSNGKITFVELKNWYREKRDAIDKFMQENW